MVVCPASFLNLGWPFAPQGGHLDFGIFGPLEARRDPENGAHSRVQGREDSFQTFWDSFGVPRPEL